MARGNSILALCLVVATAGLGMILARAIPSAIFPEIQFNRALITADAGDLPAPQMLVAVTRPLEEAAYDVVGVKLVRSTTTRGSAEIDVDFNDGTDPITGFQLLNAALGEVRGKLPADTVVDSRLMTSGTFSILDIDLSSATRDLTSLTDIAQYDMVPSLHRIGGTYRIDILNGKYREYVVRLDPVRMLQHKLATDDVVNGLAKANVIASVGRMLDAHRMLLTIVSSDLHDADQLNAIPLANLGGQPVYVRDVATVEVGIKEDYLRGSSHHGAAVLVGVSRQPDGNTEAISAAAHALVDDFRARFPDVAFSFSYDQAALVRESFNSVRDAIVLGLLLAVAVVYFFTLSTVSALLAAVVVPSTIAITFAAMAAFGMTFNMMTLGGLAAGIGLFIDDAIVMIEAIHRAHTRGTSANLAIREATAELTRPLNRLDRNRNSGVPSIGLSIGRNRCVLSRAGADTGRWALRLVAASALFHAGARTDGRALARPRTRAGSHLQYGTRRFPANLASIYVDANTCAGRGGALNRRRICALWNSRHRLSAGARRRRLHPGLHHAAREHAGRYRGTTCQN